MPTEATRSLSRDFSSLKQPRKNKSNNSKLVRDIRNLSASQLFNHADQQDDRHLRRTTSQPNMGITYERSSSFTQSPRRNYLPRERHSKESYWDKKSNYDSAGYSSDASVSLSEDEVSSNFETMYEIIQQRLQKHLRRQEIFSHEEIQNACKELRRQALVTELADGWQNSLSDLEIASGMKMEVLQAIYMLRNAHRGDLFSSQESVDNQCDRLNKKVSHEDIVDGRTSTPTTPSAPDDTMLPKFGRPTSLAFTRRTDSFTSSGEGTPTNLSSPSSGRSTPSFRKKPKRPEIKLSEHNKQYKDYIEILRADSLQSLHSDDANGGANGVEISEELIAKAFLSSHMKSELNRIPPDSVADVKRDSIEKLKVQKLCMQCPSSPTSQFMIPILESDNSEDILTDIYEKLTPVFHKMKNFEEQSNQLSTIQVKIAVLQEEKRQLAALLKEKREESVFNEKNKRDVGVQKHLEFVTEISHTSSQTVLPPSKESVMVGDDGPVEIFTKEKSVQSQVIMRDNTCQSNSTVTIETSTETISPSTVDCSTEPIPKTLFMSSKACQETLSQTNSHTQTKNTDKQDISIMVGSATEALVHAGTETEIDVTEVGLQTFIECPKSDFSTMIGAPTKALVHTAVATDEKVVTEIGLQTFIESPKSNVSTQIDKVSVTSAEIQVQPPKGIDFSCGENVANLKMVDEATLISTPVQDACVSTEVLVTRECSVQCEQSKLVSVAIGDGNVYDVICDRCGSLETVDTGNGCHATSNLPTCTDDKLCDCVKPETIDTGVGNCTINDNFCDKCDNLQTHSLGVGDHTITDLFCDRCTTLQQHDVCVGGEYDIHSILCDVCDNKPATTSVAIGDGDVTDANCDNCKNNNNRDSSYFNFDFNITTQQDNSHVQQQPIICHYCGNKVDLNDDSLDETLQAMRDSMQTLASQQQHGNLKRSGARKHLNLDLADDERPGAGMYSSKDSGLVTPNSDENSNANVPSEDEEDEGSSHDDVVQACKMLHNHFSGEKPLKQQQMMKYMAIIQSLWFKTVKRRRANASVVKSYIDLFQQRIPELLETIINLSDDEGNTALHFAMTYKNLGVASILLDSGECCADLVNQAGYSPLMLGGLVGFDRKNDKYIMQRLIRMGDINKESSDTGQTPLMLAVSHGNTNMVELLLDAGCDINAVDDEGSTALMCACEHGNANVVKMLLANPDCDATVEDNEGSTALSIAMDSRRKDLALLIYGSLNFDARGRIKLSPSKQSLLGLGRRSPSPVIGRR